MDRSVGELIERVTRGERAGLSPTLKSQLFRTCPVTGGHGRTECMQLALRAAPGPSRSGEGRGRSGRRGFVPLSTRRTERQAKQDDDERGAAEDDHDPLLQVRYLAARQPDRGAVAVIEALESNQHASGGRAFPSLYRPYAVPLGREEPRGEGHLAAADRQAQPGCGEQDDYHYQSEEREQPRTVHGVGV